jgi:(p)ppGpp synthase/HD superfamily hydrolase
VTDCTPADRPDLQGLVAMGATREALDGLTGSPDRARTRTALAFADARHAGQRRKGDGAPYVLHPVEVAWLLHEEGYSDDVIAAGVLHDVLEATDTAPDELRQLFGDGVAEIVANLSEDESIADEPERKAALREQVAEAGPDAAAVFAADKVSKARELRARAARGPLDAADMTKLDHYLHSAELLDRLMPDHPLVAGLHLEIDALRALTRGDE